MHVKRPARARRLTTKGAAAEPSTQDSRLGPKSGHASPILLFHYFRERSTWSGNFPIRCVKTARPNLSVDEREASACTFRRPSAQLDGKRSFGFTKRSNFGVPEERFARTATAGGSGANSLCEMKAGYNTTAVVFLFSLSIAWKSKETATQSHSRFY